MVTFKPLKLTLYLIIYITYRDLKGNDGKIAKLSLQQRRRVQFSTLTFDPIILLHFTYHDLKVKTDQIANI